MGSAWIKVKQQQKPVVFSGICLGTVIWQGHLVLRLSSWVYYQKKQRERNQDQEFFEQMRLKSNKNSAMQSPQLDGPQVSTYLLDEEPANLEQDWVNKSCYTTQTKSGQIEAITSQIKVIYVPKTGLLELQTVVKILECSTQLSNEDYQAATYRHREDLKRVQKLNRPQLEQKLIREFNEEIETILERAQAEILYRLDIHKDIFEKSMLSLLKQGQFQQLYSIWGEPSQTMPNQVFGEECLDQSKLDSTTDNLESFN